MTQPFDDSATTGYTPHPDQLALDAGGRLGRELPCRTCGYNLRGLAPDAACPECGTAVAVSLRNDLLRFSDPAWVRGLASGAGMIFAAVLTVIAAYLLMFVVAMVAGAVQEATGGAGAGPDVAALVAAGLLMVAGLAAMVLNLVGTWRVTERDPRRESEAEGLSVRGVARWCVIGGWLLYVLTAVLAVGSELAGVYSDLAALAGLLSLPAGLLLMVGFIAIMMHLRRLALRLPDRSLGTQTAIVMWGFIAMTVGYALMLVAFIVWIAVMFASAGQGAAAGAAGAGMVGAIVLGSVGCVFLLASAVFGVWLIVLLAMYRARFGRAAREAATALPDAAALPSA